MVKGEDFSIKQEIAKNASLNLFSKGYVAKIGGKVEK